MRNRRSGMARTITTTTPPGAARAGWTKRHGGRASGAHHVGGVQPFVALLHFKLHHLALRERLEAVHLDGREVHEHILATLLFNEAVALGIIEPLHLSLSHSLRLLQGPLR